MDTSSEAYRAECEVRYAASLSDVGRKTLYEGVLKHRGQAAANRLIEAVNAERRERHAAGQGRRP